MNIEKIGRFIDKYPDQLAVEFRIILRNFRDRVLTRKEVKKLMMEKISTACNTIRPVKIKKSQKQ